jgi:hypothetical protein
VKRKFTLDDAMAAAEALREISAGARRSRPSGPQRGED